MYKKREAADIFLDAKFPAKDIFQNYNIHVKSFIEYGYSQNEILSAGRFPVSELKQNGFSPQELLKAGYPGKKLLEAGYSAEEMAKTNYSIRQAKKDTVEISILKKAGYPVSAILRTAGYPIKEIIRHYTLSELKDGNLSAVELMDAGFSSGELWNEGKGYFSVLDMRNAGVPTWRMFTGFRPVGDSTMGIIEMRLAGYPLIELKCHCSPWTLKCAGFSFLDMKRAHFSMEEVCELLKDESSSKTYTEIRQAGYLLAELKKHVPLFNLVRYAGFSIEEIKANYSFEEIFRGYVYYRGDFTYAELKALNFSVRDIIQGNKGCWNDPIPNIHGLKKAGFSLIEIIQAGHYSKILLQSVATMEEIQQVVRDQLLKAKQTETGQAVFFNRNLQDPKYKQYLKDLEQEISSCCVVM